MFHLFIGLVSIFPHEAVRSLQIGISTCFGHSHMSSVWDSAWLIIGAHRAALNEQMKECSVNSGYALAEATPAL